VCCPQLRGHAPSNCKTPDRHTQLFHAQLHFGCSAPGVGMDVGILLQQPLFPSLLVLSVTGAVRLFKRRSETEINT